MLCSWAAHLFLHSTCRLCDKLSSRQWLVTPRSWATSSEGVGEGDAVSEAIVSWITQVTAKHEAEASLGHIELLWSRMRLSRTSQCLTGSMGGGHCECSRYSKSRMSTIQKED